MLTKRNIFFTVMVAMVVLLASCASQGYLRPNTEYGEYQRGIRLTHKGIENMNETQITLMKESFDKSLLYGSKYKAEIDSCVEKAFYGTYLSGSKLHANGQADLENGDKDKAKANFEKAKIKLELAYKLKPTDENTIKRLNEINNLLNK